MLRRRFWLGTTAVAAATATVVGLAGLAQAEPFDWKQIDVGDLGEQGSLEAIDAVAADSVWAVGSNGPKGERSGLARHWDGTRWAEVPLPEGTAYLSDVRAFSDTDVWAVGDDAALHWNGKTWKSMKLALPDDGNPWMNSLDGTSGDDLWAVGNTGAVGGGPDGYAFLEHYDGTQWSQVDLPVPDGMTQYSARQVTAVASDDVWVVGSAYDSGTEKPLLTHWDGSKWTMEDLKGLPEGAGTAVASLDGEAWMVGFGGDPDDTTDGVPMLLRKDGDKWTEVDTPDDTAWFYSLTTDGQGGLIAGGYTQDGTAILHWNGETAQLKPGPVEGQGPVTDVDKVPGAHTNWAIGNTAGTPWSAHS